MNRLNEKSYGELHRDERFEGGVINGTCRCHGVVTGRHVAIVGNDLTSCANVHVIDCLRCQQAINAALVSGFFYNGVL